MRPLKLWLYLFVGFFLCGLSIALMVRADLGLGPWDAFQQGLSRRTGLSMGTVQILVGVVVMLAWVPLKLKPGLSTVLNALTIGFMTDFCLHLIPYGHGLPLRWAMLLAGYLLGGTVGYGTLAFAALIGPLVHFMLDFERRIGLVGVR